LTVAQGKEESLIHKLEPDNHAVHGRRHRSS